MVYKHQDMSCIQVKITMVYSNIEVTNFQMPRRSLNWKYPDNRLLCTQILRHDKNWRVKFDQFNFKSRFISLAHVLQKFAECVLGSALCKKCM